MKEQEEHKEHEKLLKECFLYFTETPILRKVLKGLVDKYRSFGMVCGKVSLRNLDQEAVEALEGFTGKNYHGKKSAVLSAEGVQGALERSRFRGVLLKELFDLFYTGDLKSKKEEQWEKKEDFQSFYYEICDSFEGTPGGMWLKAVLEQHLPEELILQKRYRGIERQGKTQQKNIQQGIEQQEAVRKNTRILLEALNHLPVFQKEYAYLPAFAARFARDPHHFDEGKPDTLLFYYGIYALLKTESRRGIKWTGAGMAAEQKHQLLLEAGLIKDPLSNDAMVYGLRGYTGKEEHMGLNGFYYQQEPLSLTMSTIMKLTRISCNEKHIYAVENPIVFARLIENPQISAVCMNGQPNLAVLMLLDRVISEGTIIYYNGDFDPEGLLIAERLKKRYQEQLILWHYQECDYQSALSDRDISEQRLKMLNSIETPELASMAVRLRRTKKAGYQERIFFSDL